MEVAKIRVTTTRSFSCYKRVVFIVMCLPVLFACYSGKGQETPRVHFPNARTSQDGEIWMKWDKSQRVGFIDGYIQGRRQGYQKGCGTAGELFSQRAVDTTYDLLGHCLGSEKGFTAPIERYEEEITEFYKKYPTDLEVPMTYVLRFLSDEYGKDPEQIHEWYLSYKSHDRSAQPK